MCIKNNMESIGLGCVSGNGLKIQFINIIQIKGGTVESQQQVRKQRHWNGILLY